MFKENVQNVLLLVKKEQKYDNEIVIYSLQITI